VSLYGNVLTVGAAPRIVTRTEQWGRRYTKSTQQPQAFSAKQGARPNSSIAEQSGRNACPRTGRFNLANKGADSGVWNNLENLSTTAKIKGKKPKQKAKIQFHDANGKTRSGRGRMPERLKDKDKEKFRVLVIRLTAIGSVQSPRTAPIRHSLFSKRLLP
jgi:hypothetical protein